MENNENLMGNNENLGEQMNKPSKISAMVNFFKKHMKILVPIIVVVLVLLIVIIVFLVTKPNDGAVTYEGNKITSITAEGIVKDEKYKGLEFSNATLIKENDIYTLSLDVKNISEEKSQLMSVDIPIKDKNGNVIITLLGYIGQELEPNETTTITASTSADLSTAYTKEITEKK